jgi:hypothetical protein
MPADVPVCLWCLQGFLFGALGVYEQQVLQQRESP